MHTIVVSVLFANILQVAFSLQNCLSFSWKIFSLSEQTAFNSICFLHPITKTRLFKYIENFISKNWQFSDRKTLIFFIFLLKTYIVGTR